MLIAAIEHARDVTDDVSLTCGVKGGRRVGRSIADAVECRE